MKQLPKKLQHWYDDSGSIKAINQLIDYLTPSEEEPKQADEDWIDEARNYWDEYRDQTKSFKVWFREAIEKHMPKQELIPLDVDYLTWAISWIHTISIVRSWVDFDGMVKSELSKYGVQQKKFTREEIQNMFPHYEWSKIDWAIQFAKNNWLLAE